MGIKHIHTLVWPYLTLPQPLSISLALSCSLSPTRSPRFLIFSSFLIRHATQRAKKSCNVMIVKKYKYWFMHTFLVKTYFAVDIRLYGILLPSIYLTKSGIWLGLVFFLQRLSFSLSMCVCFFLFLQHDFFRCVLFDLIGIVHNSRAISIFYYRNGVETQTTKTCALNG